MNTGGREIRVTVYDVSKSFFAREAWNEALLNKLPFTPVNAFFIRWPETEPPETAQEIVNIIYGLASFNIGVMHQVGLTVWFESESDAAMVKLFFS